MGKRILIQRYPHFVIASQHRSGSHFLRTALRDRSRVWCHGEIFNRHHGTPKDHWDGKMPLSEWLDTVYRVHPAKTWGFLVHTPHWIPYEKVRVFIRDRACKFVVISRRDTLRQACSLLIAQKTGVWVMGKKQTNPTRLVIRPTPEDLLAAVSCLNAEHRNNLCLTRDTPTLELVYEDMIAQPQPTFARVQRFLDLAPKSLRADTKKQERRSLREILGNYDELARHSRLSDLFAKFADEKE